MTYNALSRDVNLEMKLPAVPDPVDNASSLRSISDKVLSVSIQDCNEKEKPKKATYPDLSVYTAFTSSSSSDELLGVFDQNCNEKEKPIKDTYQEFCIKAVWKQSALL
jgi:hypothetical protein